jgi:hypothetical protein
MINPLREASVIFDNISLHSLVTRFTKILGRYTGHVNKVLANYPIALDLYFELQPFIKRFTHCQSLTATRAVPQAKGKSQHVNADIEALANCRFSISSLTFSHRNLFSFLLHLSAWALRVSVRIRPRSRFC